jgi:hypothetical protein
MAIVDSSLSLLDGISIIMIIPTKPVKSGQTILYKSYMPILNLFKPHQTILNPIKSH